MISYTNRFHGYNALRYVYKNGGAIRGQSITVKFSNNPRRKIPRFAVVVSKKVLKSAVGRNRIRRRIYEIIRSELSRVDGGRDVVVIVTHRDVMTAEHNKLRDTVTSLFASAGLYKTDV